MKKLITALLSALVIGGNVDVKAQGFDDYGYKSATIVVAGPDKAWKWKDYYCESNTLFITGNNPEKTKGLIGNFLKIKKINTRKLSKNIRYYYDMGDSIELD